MSNETTSKFSLVDVSELPESVDNALKNLTDEPSKNVGHTLGDIWYLVFGGISQAAEKKRLRYAKDLELYHQELDSKITKIPDEHYQEPSIQITAQSLETSKYCVSEPELRKMFVNLISNSMDARKSASVHPSFPEIIKQMTSFDANIISGFSTSRSHPIADFVIKGKSGKQSILFRYAYLGFPQHPLQDCASSISSLERLGLLKVRYDIWLADNSAYMPFKEVPEYLSLEFMHKKLSPDKEMDISKGLCELTPLGENFIKACLP